MTIWKEIGHIHETKMIMNTKYYEYLTVCPIAWKNEL